MEFLLKEVLKEFEAYLIEELKKRMCAKMMV